MKILAYNAGAHDGAAVLIENGRLSYAIESEKDSGERYSALSPTVVVRSLEFSDSFDVVAISGWQARSALEKDGKCLAPQDVIEAGYHDETPGGKTDREACAAGRKFHRFSSSHVRSHIMCSYGLAPFPQARPCYVLVWEGLIGAMYHVDEHVFIRKIGDVLPAPGARYCLLYGLAHPGFLTEDPAGKLMALAAYGRHGPPTDGQREVVQTLLSLPMSALRDVKESTFRGNEFYDIGVETQEFKDLAWQFSAAMFDRFYRFAKENVQPGLPLLIAGGCGLNCDWNTSWRECGLFSDVFVPPCTNDSGVALGAAVDALHHYTGRAKVEWSVYVGDTFVEDVATPPDFAVHPLSLPDVCRRLLEGDVIAWVQGRYEMGPRALGNRSLLAAPFLAEARDKLNRIKQRESFRPVAPICLEDEFGLHFESPGPSPHMLYFQRVKSRQLAAITHVDGSARGQSVNEVENPGICALLREFREQSGVGVLCNTSLNFKGRGFVNRLSHLFALARDRGIDGLVVGSQFWVRRSDRR